MGTVIKVTAEHVAASEPASCTHDGVALAVRAAFPYAANVQITAGRILMDECGRRVEIPLPQAAQDAVAALGNSEHVEPFEFAVEHVGRRLATVNVTADHIRWGLTTSCRENALALGIHDAIPEAEYVATTYDTATLTMPSGREVKILLPEEAARFGRDYRDSKPVKPFTFTLEVPA